MRYRRISFALPRLAEEALAERLWALGTLGLELADRQDGRRRVDAWFHEPPPAELTGGSESWPPAGVELIESLPVDEEDWMAAYRRQARPVRVGSRLMVDPRDVAGRRPGRDAPGVRWLHLPARRAFGTGSHASTRLAVELMEPLELAGRLVLDLGTGTGILAFAALLGGARRVVALDHDPVAALIAGQNRAANRLWPAIAAGAVGCLAAERRFDLALVNILPGLVFDDLPALAARLVAGADAVFSGLLAADRRRYEERLGELGLVPHAWRQSGEWLALSARVER